MTVLLTSARCFAACGWLVVAIQLNPASNLVPACSGIPGSVISYSQPAGHPFSSLVVSNPLWSAVCRFLCFSYSFVDPSPLSVSCSFYSLHDSSRICLSNSYFLFFAPSNVDFRSCSVLNKLSGVFSLYWSLHFGFPFPRTSITKGGWQDALEFAPLLLHSRHSLLHRQSIYTEHKITQYELLHSLVL